MSEPLYARIIGGGDAMSKPSLDSASAVTAALVMCRFVQLTTSVAARKQPNHTMSDQISTPCEYAIAITNGVGGGL
jgi:hypothetical protein